PGRRGPPPPRDRHPRRADHRPGPHAGARRARADPRAGRVPHGPPLEPHPVRGREGLRTGADPEPGAPGGLGHPGGDREQADEDGPGPAGDPGQRAYDQGGPRAHPRRGAHPLVGQGGHEHLLRGAPGGPGPPAGPHEVLRGLGLGRLRAGLRAALARGGVRDPDGVARRGRRPGRGARAGERRAGMRTFLALTRRELGVYFVSPMAYIILTGLLLLSGWVFFLSMGNAAANQLPADFSPTLSWLAYI